MDISAQTRTILERLGMDFARVALHEHPRAIPTAPY